MTRSRLSLCLVVMAAATLFTTEVMAQRPGGGGGGGRGGFGGFGGFGGGLSGGGGASGSW